MAARARRRSLPRTRLAAAFVVLLLVGLADGAGGSASASTLPVGRTSSPPVPVPDRPGTTKPTVVLVHGAWADASSWSGVAARLRRDGFRVSVPTLALTSVAADVAQVRGVLDATPGTKILVAHSYGGIVTSGAAAGRTDVLGLVYAAAFVPAEGDSIASLGTGYTASEAFAHLAFTGTPYDSPAYIAPDLFGQYFAQDLPPAGAALLDAGQQPLNFSIVTTPSGPVGWATLPSWYAVSGQDRMIDPAEERWMAARAGSDVVEYPGASHVGGITRHAASFTRLIERAVTATRP